MDPELRVGAKWNFTLCLLELCQLFYFSLADLEMPQKVLVLTTVKRENRTGVSESRDTHYITWKGKDKDTE